MIKIEHKDGETNVKNSGGESVVLTELTCATRAIYDFIAGRRGKDTANQILQNVFRLAQMSEEELEKEFDEKKEFMKRFEKFFNPGGTL